MIFQYWRKCRLTSEFSFMRWALAECSIQKGQIRNGRTVLPQWRRRSIRQKWPRIVQCPTISLAFRKIQIRNPESLAGWQGPAPQLDPPNPDHRRPSGQIGQGGQGNSRREIRPLDQKS